jgi:cell wall-associated NlpC family hydrolase
VETDDYPAPSGRALYVDRRFIELRDEKPEAYQRKQPGREQIIAMLKAAIGSPYVWGGNVQSGVPELAEIFYRDIAENEIRHLTLAGLDCSGLLYQATGGRTPRNTSQLISFGTALEIEGKKAEEIAANLQPLDLIVWSGHVIIVLDRDTVVESRLACGKPGNGGVVTTPLVRRVQELMRTRRPRDRWPTDKKTRDVFVVRRWFGL